MNQPASLASTYPGGFYLGFNAQIDRKAAEQLVYWVSEAVRNRFETVTLLLSSAGGILDHAIYVCGVLDALPVKIVTYNMGSVMSAANLLFLCGDLRYATEGSIFYFHQTYAPAPAGEQVSLSFARSRAKSLHRDDSRSAGIVAAKIGRPAKEVRDWQRRELFMDTGAALARGIINGVEAPVIAPNALLHQVIV